MPALDPPTATVFTDRLRLILTVVLPSGSVDFPSGSIELVDVEVLVYGFRADVGVYVSSEIDDDPLFAAFITDASLQATLSMASCLLDGTGEENTPITIAGFVVQKRMTEVISDEIAGSPVVGRSYWMRFVDVAAAFWTQHHPIELKVDASMADILTQYKPQGMDLTIDWGRMREAQEILCISTSREASELGRAGRTGKADELGELDELGDLGEPNEAGETGAGVSFYDVWIWYVARFGGVIELDASTGTYRVGGGKVRPATTVELEKEHVAQITHTRPEPARHAVRLLNGWAEGATTTSVTNDLAFPGIYADPVVRTPLTSMVDRQHKTEADRLHEPGDELSVSFVRCPPRLYLPGTGMKPDGEFSAKLRLSGKTFRMVELRLKAVASESEGEQEPELDDDAAPFDASFEIRLEVATSPRVRLPEFTPPSYPIRVEGKVVSEGGGADDRTWMILAGANDSITRYKVEIPLWNVKVVAPFEPSDVPGHLFFPAYKGERVLVSLTFDGALITGHVDWAANARTPAEQQGNRLAFGHRALDGTVFDHAYVDAKPVLTISRTYGNDLQTLVIKEGTIRLEVREDPAAAEITPTYDVTVVVTASKERVAGEVQGAIGDLTGSFESSFGDATASVENAIEAVGGAIGAMEVQLVGKIEQVDVALQDIAASVAATTAAVSDAVAQAKAALLAALA